MIDRQRIILVDDEEIIHRTVSTYLRDCGHEVYEAREGLSALNMIGKQEYDIAIVDIRMPGIDGLTLLGKIGELRPRLPVVIISGHGTMETVIQALRLGAVDYLKKPFKLRELDSVLERSVRLARSRLEQESLGKSGVGEQTQRAPSALIAHSPAMLEVERQIEHAVQAGCDTILVLGETGTGKEVVARRIHSLASSEERPFVAVSCPAFSETLAESELFGHVKGAFTGATESKPGYFELADGGTLFLDEVGDLSPALQSKLLRVLETRTLRRIGGEKEIQVNVRVVAATNVPLADRVESGEFRKDLYYRLNLFSIELSPLRERREDIIPLAESFLRGFLSSRSLEVEGFSEAARQCLLDYGFPGNARELRNLTERAAIFCRKGLIEPKHLQMRKEAGYEDLGLSAEDEATRILAALRKSRWNRREAATLLDMPYSTLRYKIQRYGIE